MIRTFEPWTVSITGFGKCNYTIHEGIELKIWGWFDRRCLMPQYTSGGGGHAYWIRWVSFFFKWIDINLQLYLGQATCALAMLVCL